MNSARFLVVVILGMAVEAVGAVFAQATGTGNTSPLGLSSNEQLLLSLATSLTPTGFLTWYCWYTTAKTIPRLQTKFGEEAAAVRIAHDVMVERQCKDFHETLSAVMAQYKSDTAEHRAAIERMSEMVMTVARHCPAPKEKEKVA